MWYHLTMLDTSETRPRRRDAEDISVQINVRIPYHYRETLIRLAEERSMSLNRLAINALVAAYPPEQ
jgi:predicted HicB family RNase H-like nuclease